MFASSSPCFLDHLTPVRGVYFTEYALKNCYNVESNKVMNPKHKNLG